MTNGGDQHRQCAGEIHSPRAPEHAASVVGAAPLATARDEEGLLRVRFNEQARGEKRKSADIAIEGMAASNLEFRGGDAVMMFDEQ